MNNQFSGKEGEGMIKRLKLKNIFKCLTIITFSILVFTPKNAYSGTAIASPSTAEEQDSWLPILIEGSFFYPSNENSF